ncbi:hypothetical protein AAF712_014724 [Marasmius tenuissimus]|uniref:Uncharacterized protein n=1 Tax=Marasmius tenuissimus TaxID=585030 RepID=A0ABR2ZBD8_9AGAR
MDIAELGKELRFLARLDGITDIIASEAAELCVLTGSHWTTWTLGDERTSNRKDHVSEHNKRLIFDLYSFIHADLILLSHYNGENKIRHHFDTFDTNSTTMNASSFAPKRPHLQIIIEDSEDLSDSPRPSFSSGRSTPDKRRPKLNEIRLAKQRSEEDILSSTSLLSAPRPAPRPPTPASCSSIHLSPRSASPSSFTRATSPLPQSVTARSATPSPTASPDALHLSFQFPRPPQPTVSRGQYANPSPFSSPSSVSSGLPITPDQSPLPSPKFAAHERSESSSTSSQLRRLRSIKPLTIVKKHELAFDTFFSTSISPSTASYSSEDQDNEPLMSLEPISFAHPVSPIVSKPSCDPFVVVPSLRAPSPSLDEQDADEEEFYSSEISSMLTLHSAMPQRHDLLRPRPESLAPQPRPRIRVSKPLPDIPYSPSPISATDESGARKGCFPSAQLDPAWGRRSFLIPSRPPPPPPGPLPSLPSSSRPASPPSKKSRPPSLALAKPLPRSSIVPDDEIDGSSIFSFYGISSFADSDYLSAGHSGSSSSVSSGSRSGSSSGHSEASSLPTSPSSDEFDAEVEDEGFEGDVLEVELDAFDVQFGVDPLGQFDMESDLMLPVSLPGSPVPYTPVEADLDVEEANGSDAEDYDRKPVLRSRWSSSTLSSVRIKSPQTPSSSAVSKFKLYFRGNHTRHQSASTSTSKKRRSVVVVGPSATTESKRMSEAAALTSARFSVPRSPKSPSTVRSRSTMSSFSFDTPLSPTFSLSPTTTSTAPLAKLSPAALRRLGAEAALSTTSPAALKRLGVGADGVDEKKLSGKKLSRRASSSSVASKASVGSSGSEKKRKPIPIEMFLRV